MIGKDRLRGWGHYLQLALTCLQVAWGNVTKLSFPEDNIRKAFHEVQVFPALPTAGEDSGRKRVKCACSWSLSGFLPGAHRKEKQKACHVHNYVVSQDECLVGE